MAKIYSNGEPIDIEIDIENRPIDIEIDIPERPIKYVKQQPLGLMPEGYIEVEHNGKTINATILSDGEWWLDCPSWIEPSKTHGNGNEQIELVVTRNLDNESHRESSVVLTDYEGNRKSLTIYQGKRLFDVRIVVEGLGSKTDGKIEYSVNGSWTPYPITRDGIWEFDLPTKTIPNLIPKINDKTFRACIKSIEFNNKVFEIGQTNANNTDCYNHCTNLTSIRFNSGVVIRQGAYILQQYFYNCSKLTEVTASSWDMSSAQNLSYMFDGCSSLQSIDVSGWDMSSAQNLSYMFNDCSSLQSIDVSGWDMSSAQNLSNMFNDCSSLTDIKGSGDWDMSSAQNLSNMFQNCSSLQSIDVSGWDMSSAQNLSGMFNGCSSLTDIKGSGDWELPNVTDIVSMFEKCSSLVSVDVTHWGCGKLRGMSRIITNCTLFERFIGMENWASDGSYFDGEFWYTFAKTSSGVSSLKEFRLGSNGSFKIRYSSNFGNMFAGTNTIEYIDLSGWECVPMNSNYGLSLWGTFNGCSRLKRITFGNLDVGNYGAQTQGSMFANCSVLEHIDGTIRNIKWNVPFDLNACPLDRESAVMIMSGLYPDAPSPSTRVQRFSSYTKQLLTPEDIAIATAKGWTIA